MLDLEESTLAIERSRFLDDLLVIYKPLVRKLTCLSFFFGTYLVFIAFQFTNNETAFYTKCCIILKIQLVAFGLLSSELLP